MKEKIVGILICVLMLATSIAPVSGVFRDNDNVTEISTNIIFDKINFVNNETEYWALLIAVGVYAGHPEEDRPTMLVDVENLREKLIVSSHWKEENIKVIKGKNATFFNIIRGLRWLDKKEDKNDLH